MKLCLVANRGDHYLFLISMILANIFRVLYRYSCEKKLSRQAASHKLLLHDCINLCLIGVISIILLHEISIQSLVPQNAISNVFLNHIVFIGYFKGYQLTLSGLSILIYLNKRIERTLKLLNMV